MQLVLTLVDSQQKIHYNERSRSGSRTAATSKVERFVIIVNGFQLPIVTKGSILDVAAVLDPPLNIASNMSREQII